MREDHLADHRRVTGRLAGFTTQGVSPAGRIDLVDDLAILVFREVCDLDAPILLVREALRCADRGVRIAASFDRKYASSPLVPLAIAYPG